MLALIIRFLASGMSDMRTKHAENYLRKSGTQNGCRGAKNGAGRRKTDHLPERRSGARYPGKLYQSFAGSGREACQARRLHGAQILQVAALLLLIVILLSGCGANRKPEQASVPPPPSPPVVETVPAHPDIAVPPHARALYTETGCA